MKVLNDQGGGVISVVENLSPTLRAQDHGHPPLILEEMGNLNKDDFQSKGIFDVNGAAPALYSGEKRFGGGECYVLTEETMSPRHCIIVKAATILKAHTSEIRYKRVDEINGWYFWNPVRGGLAVLINDEGESLGATSSVSFSRHLEEFKNGRRDG